MNWAIEEKAYSQRRACGLIGLAPKSYRYASRRSDDAAVRLRLKALASERRRFGYRRLHILLKREGIVVNHKKLFRLYREERLTVRRRGGRKRALVTRAPMTLPQGPNQRWSLDFVADQFVDGRRFRVLVVVDDLTRECLALVVDTSLSGIRVARELDTLIGARGKSLMIVSDNGTELTSRAVLQWQEEQGVEWHDTAPGKPTREMASSKASMAASATSASTSTCSEGSLPLGASLKSGELTPTPAGRIGASAASPPTSSQPGPRGITTRTESSYERRRIGGNVRRHVELQRTEPSPSESVTLQLRLPAAKRIDCHVLQQMQIPRRLAALPLTLLDRFDPAANL